MASVHPAPITRRLAPFIAAGARHVAGVLLGLLTLPLVARVLGHDALALWALLGTSSFLLGCADLGLSTAVSRAVAADDTDRAHRVLAFAERTVLRVGPPAALALYFTLPSVPAASGLSSRDVTAASIVFLTAGVVSAYAFPARALVMVRGGMHGLAFARTAGALTQLGTIAVALALAPSLTSAALGPLLGACVETGLTLRVMHTIAPNAPRTPFAMSAHALLPGEARSSLHTGAATLALNAAVLLALRADVFILARVGTLATVATYAVASRAVDQSFTLAKQLSAALLPRLANRAERTRTLERGTMALGAIVWSGMTALAMSGPTLLRAWAGSVADGPVLTGTLVVLGTAAGLAALHEVATATLSLGGHSGWDAAWPEIQGAAINLVVSIAFASSLGPLAVAGGTVIGNAWITAQVWRRARVLTHLSWPRVFAVMRPAVLACAGSAVVGYALRGFAERGPLDSALACCAAMLAGLALALLGTSRHA